MYWAEHFSANSMRISDDGDQYFLNWLDKNVWVMCMKYTYIYNSRTYKILIWTTLPYEKTEKYNNKELYKYTLTALKK